jgi:hypothetical protein
VIRALRKVISGGQTGVDQAALRAARDSGLEIGGWCPPGRQCETGAIPSEFPMKETDQERSPNAPDVPRSQRTEWNVRDSDGTLVIQSTGASNSEAATEDAGTKWTMKCAARYKRPLLVCEVDDPNAKEKIRQWLAANATRTLNIAGPRESIAPGIADRAYLLLRPVFEKMESE